MQKYTEMWDWFLKIKEEATDPELSEISRGYLQEYYSEAGLLRAWRRSFFKVHFSDNFADAAEFLLATKEKPTILDLGAGCGTQALYFASKGARVIALDMDEQALECLLERKALYEKHNGQKLDIEILAGDAFKIDYKKIGPFDGVYSMFAYNMMQPTSKLIEVMENGASEVCRIAIIDGNSISWLPRLVPSRKRNVLSPPDLANAYKEFGYNVASNRGAVALPPILWIVGTWIKPIDNLLRDNWFTPFSYQALLKK